jgi:carbonic anhydrase
VGTLGPDHPFPGDAFADIMTANAEFARAFSDAELTGRAREGLAVVTCIDTRIDPLAILGMHAGDMMVIRNAGARVTDDVLRTLVLATGLLGVERILVMPHTGCRMAHGDESEIHTTIADRYGLDTRSIEFRTVDDQVEALRIDVTRIRAFPYLHEGVTVGGAVYHVESGTLEPVDA